MELRVQKIMAESGKWSRKEADELVKLGKVTINGRVAKPGDKAVPGKDHIKVMGKLLRFDVKKVVVALFKPRGIMTNRPAEQMLERGTVFELLTRIKEKVFPVGRLDTDTEGLLLLTNDGELAQRVNKSKFEIPKVYTVKIDGHLNEVKLRRLKYGIKVEDKKTRPLEVESIRRTPGKEWLKVTMTDTPNRLIRKIFENVGHPVDKVRREQIGPVSLRGMVRGQYRYLDDRELKELKKLVGMQT